MIRICFFLLFTTSLTSCTPAQTAVNQLTEAEERGGWKLIFDGKTTNGWRNYQKDAISDGWVVKDGILERVSSGAGDIVTQAQYENFEISLDYRISKGGNSGLMFHVTEDQPRPWHSGPEVQIQDNVDGHDPQKAGWLYQLYQPRKPKWATRFEQQVGFEGIDMDDATRPAGEWNQLYLRISPRGCEVAMNGVSYFYFRKGNPDWDKRVAASKFAKFPGFGKSTRGHICLQDHGNVVAFRNIKIRELSAEGTVADPVDGQLPVKANVAFPNITWEGYEPVDEVAGKANNFRPMVLTHANDDSNRLFVATQRGAFYVFPNNPEVKRARLFLDLRDKVHNWKGDNEEGMLGLAFHPNYRTNGQFYVYYSSAAEPRTSIVARYTRSKDDADRADPDSEQIIMKIPQPFSNHNGGSIVFGKDGYLYIALGDGGGRNDPLQHGQNLSTWMGSVLRIDVDTNDGDQPYGIPADNPFVHTKDAKPEIFAFGLRNVWRLTVDRSSGDLWAADVGQDFWEEINILKKGGNYGWSVREGSAPFNKNPLTHTEFVAPVWEYDHQVGTSITGGYVYRGNRVAALRGFYLYADFVRGRIWGLQYDRESKKVLRNMAIPSPGLPVMAFGEDAAGEIYFTVQTVDGRGIYRFDAAEQ